VDTRPGASESASELGFPAAGRPLRHAQGEGMGGATGWCCGAAPGTRGTLGLLAPVDSITEARRLAGAKNNLNAPAPADDPELPEVAIT